MLADGQTLADALLAPHRCYLAEVEAIQRGRLCRSRAWRTSPAAALSRTCRGCCRRTWPARIVAKSWTIPPLFQQVIRWSGISREEAYRVFNLGIGMVLVLDASCAEPVLNLLPEAIVIGRLIARTRRANRPFRSIFPEKP